MKKFYLAGVLGVLLCAHSFSARAAEKKASVVTRDNFVSLDYQSTGGLANLKLQIEVQGNSIILEEFPRFGGVGFGSNSSKGVGLFSGQEINAPRPAARLSNNQLDELIRAVNKNKLPALAGKYRQTNLADGLKETLSLTISDEKNRDQTFIIENYGNKAPPGFFQTTKYLRQLRLDKFRGKNGSDDLISSASASSLAFETSGGIANIKTSLSIRRDHPYSDAIGSVLVWSQNLPGRKEFQRHSMISEAEIAEITRLLNAAYVARLNGKSFEQKQLRDGFNEVLTFWMNDGSKFTVSNYGDTAPAEYSAIVQYLNELKNKKFTATQ